MFDLRLLAPAFAGASLFLEKGITPMTKVLDRIFEFLAGVISLILVFMTLTIGYAIFARAVGLPGPLWIVQFNEYAMLFATFLGAAWLLSKKKHVSVELVVSRFSLRTQKIFDLVHSLLGMGLCGILCWYGALTTIENLQRKVIHVQAVDVPMAYVLFVIPLGFFLLVLQFVRNFVVAIRSLGSEEGEKTSEGGGP
jgi:TRAP-type C4-dicarboxylate transport system permease small subunit